MQIAYFDCFSGISGDMTLAALVDAGADLQAIQRAIGSLGIGNLRIAFSNTMRRGFRGKLLQIDHPREHAHRRLRDIHSLIRNAEMVPKAKDLAMRFFERIARAEAKVHGTTIDQVHFHEVGAVDSIVDMIGVAVAWVSLDVQRAFASPVPVGTGQVKIAHGIVQVPAPATAEILLGAPIANASLAFEMTTPTGAAILRELVEEFGSMPTMQVGRIGYGAGNADLADRPNLLRVLIGQALKPRTDASDSILVMECNLDDVTGEQIGFAIDRLWKVGALDVFTTAIQMKKSRPGTLLTVLCKPGDRKSVETILFQQTGTLGIRYRKQARVVLPRALVEVSSPWGVVAGKVSMLPTGEVDFSPEFDDCSRIAAKHGLRLTDVVAEIRECYYFHENKRDAPTLTDEASVDRSGELGRPDRDASNGSDLSNLNSMFQQLAAEEHSDDRPQERTVESVVENEELQLDYYRWDSAPWNRDRLEPLPPVQSPDPFPLDEE